MFDLSVCLLTLEKVGLMLTYIAIGFVLCRSGKLPSDSGRVLSLLTTMLFCPAYTINNFSRNFTMDKVGEKLTLFGFGVIIVLAVLVLAYGLARLMGRNTFERKSLTYAFTIPNYGYFGYPVVEGVFGAAALGDMMVFCIPISVVTNSFGYLLFAADGKLSWKKVLLSPMLLSVFIGAVIGLSGLQLPGIVTGVLTGAGNCMSPASMLLAGFVLGAMPLKELLSDWRSYLYNAIRLLGIPALFVAVMFMLGIRDMQLLIPGLVLSLPLGLNLVVFPESCGYDAKDNAKMCCVSYLMAIVILPITFSILQALANM